MTRSSHLVAFAGADPPPGQLAEGTWSYAKDLEFLIGTSGTSICPKHFPGSVKALVSRPFGPRSTSKHRRAFDFLSPPESRWFLLFYRGTPSIRKCPRP